MAASMTRRSGRRTSYGSHNLGQSPEAAGFGVLDVLGWLLFFLTAAYVFGWLLPRRGVEFSDEGWYLYSGLMAAQGQNYLTMVPQAPFHLLYALFMRLGAENLLTFRILSHGLYILSLGVFLSGLSPANRLRFPVPLGMAMGLVMTLFSLISYHDGPPLFLLMALGVYFLAEDARDIAWSKDLAWASGAILALSPMTNVTVAPSVGLCFLLLFFRGEHRPLFWRMAASFSIFFAAMFGWYLSTIGLTVFFRPPSGFSQTLDLTRLWDALRYSWQWPALWMLVAGLALGVRALCAMRPVFDRNALQLLAAILLPLLCLLFLGLAAVQYVDPGPRLDLLPAFNFLKGKLFYWIRLMPLMFLFQLVGFLGPAILSLALVTQKNEAPVAGRIWIAATLLWAVFINKRFFGNTESSLLSVLFYSAAMAALGLYAFYDAARERRRFGAGGAVLLSSLLVLGLGVLHTLAYNHPGAVAIRGEKSVMGLPKLAGILETPQRSETLKGLDKGYKELGCADKTFITFRGTSFLYYYFGRKALPGLEYVFPHFIAFPGKKIEEEFGSGREWCVFVSQNMELDEDWTQVKPTLDSLETNSQEIVRLNPSGVKRHVYDDFTLYAGPKKQPAAQPETLQEEERKE